MLADHRGQFEPVEIGHADIDQHDGDIGPQKLLQRLIRRAGLDQVLPELAEDHLIAEQLPRLVVDQQNVDLVLRAHGAVFHITRPSGAATSAMRRAAVRC